MRMSPQEAGKYCFGIWRNPRSLPLFLVLGHCGLFGTLTLEEGSGSEGSGKSPQPCVWIWERQEKGEVQDVCEHIVTCVGMIKGFKVPCLSLLGELCTSHLSLLSKELPLFLLGQAPAVVGNHQPMMGNHQLLPCHGVGGETPGDPGGLWEAVGGSGWCCPPWSGEFGRVFGVSKLGRTPH